MNLKTYLKDKQALIEKTLAGLILEEDRLDDFLPRNLFKSMRYSLLDGGKRLRPVLVLAGCEAVGGDPLRALGVSAALEMIHTYSLIHDDLPAMDNDDLRRGRPTNHKVFGEAMGILTGDALLTEAFHALTHPVLSQTIPPATLVEVVRDVALAAGARGMVGGQVQDMEAEKRKISLEEMQSLHAHKTGCLIRVAVVSGGKVGGGSPQQITALAEYGRLIGLGFQIADDILDVEQSSEQLGKTAGKDVAQGKSTYPALLGLAGAKQKASQTIEAALDSLENFNTRAEPLRAIARYIIEREK